jgi:hypothetical protein
LIHRGHVEWLIAKLATSVTTNVATNVAIRQICNTVAIRVFKLVEAIAKVVACFIKILAIVDLPSLTDLLVALAWNSIQSDRDWIDIPSRILSLFRSWLA